MKNIHRAIAALLLLIGFLNKPAHAQLTVDFTASVTQGCAPIQVNFTDLSSGVPSPNSWIWTFGNGNSSTSQNPSATYFTPGTYNVKLVVSNGIQTDSIIKVNYITVYQNPTAQFTISPPNPCISSLVTFTSGTISGGAPVISYSWSFGDGNVATTTTDTISHNYSFANAFPVNLIVTDSNGCSDSYDTTIAVSPNPVASFTPSPGFSCTVPATISFNNTSQASGAVSYQWYFGDGGTSNQQNPQHTYTAGGTYYVSLVVTQNSGCRDSMVNLTPLYIGGPVLDVHQSDTVFCVYDSVQFWFFSSTPPVSYQWNFGDGTTSNASPVWHTFPSAGQYAITVTCTDINGCIGTETINVIVNPQPVANFSPQNVLTCLLPATIQFQDSSIGATTWNWNFGDGTNSNLQNPSHTFAFSSAYIVNLITTNQFGCTDTFAGTVAIDPPKAGFDILPKSGCVPLNVLFSSTSSAIEPISQYTWNFGAGQGSQVTASPSASHTYSTPGTYIVSLIIETTSGCRDTIIDSVRAGDHVIPSFTYSDDTVCYNTPVMFTSTTVGANEWQWIYGDGTSDTTIENPTHIFADTGTFTVTLIACYNGCCDTLVQQLIITILPPIARFAFAPHDCDKPYEITVINTSVESDSSVWDFGDGTILSSNASPITHVYAARGVYPVKLITYNFTTGCIDSMIVTRVVTDPVAGFMGSPLSGCYPLQVAISDTSIDGYTYFYSFGDGSDTTGVSSISYVYAFPGYYSLMQIITDVYGCPDTMIKNQYVHVYGPTAGFINSPNSGCRPLTVSFTDTTVSEYPVTTFIWNYGDGTIDTVTSASTSHTYNLSGNFTVSLIVIDSLGCKDTLIKPFLITVTKPVPAMTVDTFACRNEIIAFNGTGSAYSGPATFYWNFGDGTLDTTNVPSNTHAYSSDGTYVITFKITDVNGCDSVISKTIRIEHPFASFSFTEMPGCRSNPVVLTNTSTGTGLTSAYWDLGNGAISTNFGTASYNYSIPGTYTVSLIVTNSAGCTDTAIQNNAITVPGPVGTFSFAPQSGCIPLNVTFNMSSPNSQSFVLDFGDGAVQTFPSTTTTVQHTYTQNFNVIPRLILQVILPDSSVCKDTLTAGTLDVYTGVDVTIVADGDTAVQVIEVTQGQIVQLSSFSPNATGPFTYGWTPSAGLSDPDIQNPTLQIQGGTGTELYYYAMITDGGGCQGIDSILVRIVDCNEKAEVYNVFTPNGDGNNDEFEIKYPCYDNFLLLIYNRWGQKIYETSNPDVRWKGLTSNGKIVPDGTYYWILTNGTGKRNGFVQLIRK